MDYSSPALADRLAAEYIAGTLRGAARRRFEALLPAHPALRQAVETWSNRLAPLTQSIVPVVPPPSVWQRIEARIGRGSMPAALPWWQQLAVWRGFSAVATLAALTFGLLLASPEPARPPMVVVLNATPAEASAGSPPSAQPATFVASISADGRAMVTHPLRTVAARSDRALELWSVPASGAPRSLGVISASTPTVVRKGRVLDNTAAFAVTDEPPGGSPSGAPTGPILYLGKLVL